MIQPNLKAEILSTVSQPGLSLQSNGKYWTDWSTLKQVTSMSSTSEPAIWSCDTDQWIPTIVLKGTGNQWNCNFMYVLFFYCTCIHVVCVCDCVPFSLTTASLASFLSIVHNASDLMAYFFTVSLVLAPHPTWKWLLRITNCKRK